MEIEVIPLSKVVSRLGVSEGIVEALVRRGILPVLQPSGAEEPMVPVYAVEQVQVHAYRALLRHHITRPEPPDEIKVDYRWGIEMRDWLCHNPEVEDFVDDFLGYLAAMSRSHSFTGFKTVVRIEVEGRGCSLRPQARGLLLTAIRNREPVTCLIESRADFGEGLAWILTLKNPTGRQKGGSTT